jgi:hypothetical protein
MQWPASIPRLTDIVESTARIRGLMTKVTLAMFESGWQRQWLVERGVEISEASRRLPDEPKAAGIRIAVFPGG